MRNVIILTLLTVFVASFVIGCGGGDGTVLTPSNTNPITGSGEGTIAVKVDWPSDSKLIYPSVTKVTIDVLDAAGKVVTTGQIVRPASTLTTPIAVAVGTYSLDIKAVKADGTIMSRYIKAGVAVVANQVTNVSATLGVVVSNGTLSPSDVWVQTNDTIYWYNQDKAVRKVKFGTTVLTLDPNDPNGVNYYKFTSTTNVNYTLTDASDTTLATGTMFIQLPVGQTYQFDASKSFAPGVGYDMHAGVGGNVSNRACDIATDSSGNFYVLERANKTVEKYTSTGAYVNTFPLPLAQAVNDARAIAVDTNGYMYILNSGAAADGNILKFNSSGIYLTAINTVPAGTPGNNAVGRSCYELCVDPNGAIYVAGTNSLGAAGNVVAVSKYDPSAGTWSGNVLTGFGYNSVFGNGGANAITGMSYTTVSGTPVIYMVGTNDIAVEGGTNVIVYRPTDGTASNVSIAATNYLDISASGTNLVMTAANTHVVTRSTAVNAAAGTLNLTVTTDVKTAGSNRGSVNNPTGIAMLTSGTWLVADRPGNNSQRLQLFDNTNIQQAHVIVYGGLGNAAVATCPTYLTRDTNGNLYVTDNQMTGTACQRIVKFDNNGLYINSWGFNDAGLNVTDFGGITVDNSGNLYAASNTVATDTIYKFNSAGTATAFTSSICGGGARGGLAADGNYLYVASGNDGIRRFALIDGAQNGNPWVGTAGTNNLTVDSTGNVYFIVNGTSLRKVNSAGVAQTGWPVTTFNSTALANLRGIAVDNAGYVYVTRLNGPIYKYSSTGSAVSSSDTWGSTIPTMVNLFGVHISASTGYMYVVDGNASQPITKPLQIKVFTPVSQ